MNKFLVVVVSVLTIATASPLDARAAGGHSFSGHQGLRGRNVIVAGPSRSPSILFVSPHHGMRFPFRDGHGFVRQPFLAWGPGVDWVDPEEVVVIRQVQFAAPLISAPVPDPKFVFPPTPSSASPAGSHTVIVQRGSRIEVLSFPIARCQGALTGETSLAGTLLEGLDLGEVGDGRDLPEDRQAVVARRDFTATVSEPTRRSPCR
jgi:hypothetical protein